MREERGGLPDGIHNVCLDLTSPFLCLDLDAEKFISQEAAIKMTNEGASKVDKDERVLFLAKYQPIAQPFQKAYIEN